jgi:hypothetical protein
MNLEQFNETLDTEFGEGDDAVVVEAVDPDEAVLWLHADRDVMKHVDVLTEVLGDEIDGLDVGDLVDVHGVYAAFADTAAAGGRQFHGSRSSSL